jgi:serine O-acetyltransferase
MDPKNPSLTGDQCEIEIDFIEGYRRQLPEVIEEIIGSITGERSISHFNSALIPSKESVIEILEELKDLLFPGYYRKQEIHTYSLSYQIGSGVNRVFENLSAQIARSIRHECRRLNSICTRCLDRGQKEALAFLKKIPPIRRILAGDVQAAYDGDPAAKSLDEIIFSYPCILAITVYRIAHELHIQGVPLLPRIMTEYAHSITGIDIHPGASVGKEFFVDHAPAWSSGRPRKSATGSRSTRGNPGALSFPKTAKGTSSGAGSAIPR